MGLKKKAQKRALTPNRSVVCCLLFVVGCVWLWLVKETENEKAKEKEKGQGKGQPSSGRWEKSISFIVGRKFKQMSISEMLFIFNHFFAAYASWVIPEN